MKRVWFSVLICILCLYCGLVSAGEKGSAKRAFSLVIREGFGSISVGDLNTTLSSINSAYDGIRAYRPERCVGEILEVPNRFKDWEAELQWAAWWGFSIGLAVSGPTRFYDKSFLTYTIVDYAGTQSENDTYESEIRVSAPIMFNLYRSFSIFSKVNLAVNGGIGYYRARMTLTEIMHLRYPLDDISLTYFNFNVAGKGVGYHCGLALEYKFNDRFSMMAEGRWRFAKIRTLKGSTSTTHQAWDEEGNLYSTGSNSMEGPLYHYIGTDLRLGRPHEKLSVNDFPPPWWGIDFPRDIREAFLDLGGFTFRIGLRIRLF